MQYRKLSHAVYHCDYHIVISTKYRRKILNKGILGWMKLRLKEIQRYYPAIYIKEVNHDQDHIHLLISIPPSMPVGRVVGIIKSNTAKELKKKFPFLKKVYWGTDSIWAGGYFVSTVGVNEAIIQKYIMQQGKEDSGQAKLVLK